MKGWPSPCHITLGAGVLLTVFKKSGTIRRLSSQHECPGVGQFPPGFPKRSGGRRLGRRSASPSWLYKLVVAQELQETFQRVDMEAVESILDFWVYTKA